MRDRIIRAIAQRIRTKSIPIDFIDYIKGIREYPPLIPTSNSSQREEGLNSEVDIVLYADRSNYPSSLREELEVGIIYVLPTSVCTMQVPLQLAHPSYRQGRSKGR